MRWKGWGGGTQTMGGKLRTAMNIMPFRDRRTENVGTFVFDHPTCVEKVGDYT